MVGRCRWLILPIADANGGLFADDGEGRHGSRQKDNEGVPNTQDG